MFRYLFFYIIFIFFVYCFNAFYSQAHRDTILTITDTVSIRMDSSAKAMDSTSVSIDSSAVDINEDSFYMPVKDSAYLNMYSLREVSQPKVDKYIANRDYEYANNPEYWKKDKIQNDPGSFSFWNFFRNKAVQWILFLGVIAIILYGIYLLAKENNFKWLNRNSQHNQLRETESARQESVDYDEAIRKYQSEGNYPMAIRYMYLRLIQTAVVKNIIQIRESSTNAEILRAFGSHPLAGEFRYLATAYEYIYFGDFNFNQEIFEGLKKRFDVFQQKLSA